MTLTPAIAEAAGRALYREANAIINDSQILVPVETGTLKASARVLEPERKGDHVEVVAGYGYGPEYVDKASQSSGVGYAVYVHEDTTKRHDPPTQSKFLEQPAQEHSQGFAGRIALEIRAALRGRSSEAA